MKDKKYKIKICRIATIPMFFVAHLMAQIEYLQNKGMEISIVSSLGEGSKNLERCKEIVYETIEIPRSLNIVQDIKALIQLIIFFRRNQFDIVHSNTPKAGLLTSIATFISKVPIRLHTFTGQPWVTLKGPLRFFTRLADKLICIINTKCYTDSRSQRGFLIKEKIVAPRKIDVIGYSSIAGVNLRRFDEQILNLNEKQELRKKLGIIDNDKVAVFIGRISRDKGIYELETAFKKIIESGYNLHLLLVGPLDEECGGEKTIEIAEFIDNPKVSYVGLTQTPEIYLSIADFLCLPSYREGFGSVVIEAAAMRVPAIGTKINGLVDAVSHSKTGVLIPPYDTEALFEAIKDFLDHPELITRMGDAAQKRCKILFDGEIINKLVFEEYKFLYKKYVQKTGVYNENRI